MQASKRISVIEMALKIAQAAAERSEDPWTKVGAVALTPDNRIVAVAYNGLLPAFKLKELWLHVNRKNDRDYRLPFMVHAEQNLCSLIKRDEASKCVITVIPCPSCLLLLATHGMRDIYCAAPYERDSRAIDIAKFYNINLIQI